MSQIKPYLPLICALVMSVAHILVAQNAYSNDANDVDYVVAFTEFTTLYGMFTAFLKMNPIAEPTE
jgi:flagellar motor component MotA